MFARWCVKDRHGRWCALMNNVRPPEDLCTAGTVCAEVIAYPWGVECREPTCHECRKRLTHARRHPNPLHPRA